MLRKYVTLRINTNFNDEPFEIAAVKIEEGAIVDTFHTFVNVAMDEGISEYYGVYPQQLVGAPSVEESIAKLSSFIRGTVLVPFFSHTKFWLEKHFPEFSKYKMVATAHIIAAVKLREDFNFRLDGFEKIKEFAECHRIRNDALGDAVVIAKLFIKYCQTSK